MSFATASDVIILAGGLGKRLRDVVPDLPKPLAPIQGVPFLDLLLERLAFASKIVLAVGYKAYDIIEHYGDSPLPLDFSLELIPLGTGGALRQALRKTSSSNVLVLNGDSFLDFSFDDFYRAHQIRDAELSIASVYVEDASRYGQLEMCPFSSRVTAFKEKSEVAQGGWINAGMYLMKRNLLERLSVGPIFSLEKEAFPQLLTQRVFGFQSAGLFIDIGTKESFLQAQEVFV